VTCIAVTETWLTTENQDYFQLPNYSFVSKTRQSKLGGGIGLYIVNSFKYNIRENLCRMLPFIECLFVEILQPTGTNIIIGCVYRPPNTDLDLFNSEILTLLNILQKEKNKLIFIAGDFNLDLLKHESHGATGEFLNSMLCHTFFPVIRRPTRISEHSATLIDNIFVNRLETNITSAVIYNDISDHLPIAVNLTFKHSKYKQVKSGTKRIYDSKSINNFVSCLAYTSWEKVYNSLPDNNVTKAYENFIEKYVDIFEKFFPETHFKQSHAFVPRKEWMTKGLIKCCKKKIKII